ncbi:alpha/beta hydrolase [Sporosarcina trichiuri]|uniref:alpha/beta hydrolase n=1 Tax=Sporosarcina trichiuri TaxID=3056445 RepID=UPI0025B4B301|nr:alpha/beta hydrolase [Sporosarcina sp. 0.2-SM1T-5]WJY28957.1 alpha/beta hydrolase [Sporosarcina sp. 0.2-SM1T-5]
MRHVFREGSDKSRPVLLLLHGTGGSEEDLLPIADIIDLGASVLSVRGNVLENGMPRFFQRLAEGVFDEEDLVYRTGELKDFINSAADEYSFDPANVVAVGYSNGANIAASLLFHYADVLKGTVLFHPMVPIRSIELPDLKSTTVWIGAGTNDPICPQAESTELQELLQQAGASVELHWEHAGHQLTMQEVKAAKDWYDLKFA